MPHNTTHTAKLTYNELNALYRILKAIQEQDYLNDIKELAKITLRPLTNRVHARTWEMKRGYSIRINPAEKIALRLYQLNTTDMYDYSVLHGVIEPILRR